MAADETIPLSRQQFKHGEKHPTKALVYCKFCKQWSPMVYATCYNDECFAPFPADRTKWNSQ